MVNNIRRFIQLESSAGIILLMAAMLALIFSNTPLHTFYQAIIQFPLGFQIGHLQWHEPLVHWINDGLMPIFFLLVTLEIKREIFAGELAHWRHCALPLVAAIGGMLLPAIIYFLFNMHQPTGLRGWAIPTATDIAFSLGIVSLLGKRVPFSLKIFLTALAIFDDVGAILIIAFFYTTQIALPFLGLSTGCAFLLGVFNYFRMQILSWYWIVGGLLWLCLLHSGIHTTLAGIAVGLAIPLQKVRTVENKLHAWVTWGILPLFAFMNAGVAFIHFTPQYFYNPIALGVVMGLVLGKPLGIGLFSWLAIKFRVARLPHEATLIYLYAIGLVAGIGFTVSLFVSNLAFEKINASYLEMARFGVLAGSLLAGVLGAMGVVYLSKWSRRGL